MPASYRLSRTFPRSETYGLSSQLQRATVSLAANTAEGFKKHGKAGRLRFYIIPQVSDEEFRTYLILAQDIEFGDVSELNQLLEEVNKLSEAYSQVILDSAS